MCLIITALSALISFILLKIKGYRFFKELFIMFFSAALMWTVDCTFACAHGEGFFDLSYEDTLLGMIIVVSALVFLCMQSFALNKNSYRPKSSGIKVVSSGKRIITTSARIAANSIGSTGGVICSIVRSLIFAPTYRLTATGGVT